MRVAVVVLGELARSPRMLYHAEALAAQHAAVDLIGYADEPIDVPAGVHVRPLPSPRRPGDQSLSRARFLFLAVGRVLSQCTQVLHMLVRCVERPDVILVQTPPAMPTLLSALIAARFRRARLIIDWHNFGFSLLGLRLGPTHSAVRLSRWYERRLGSF